MSLLNGNRARDHKIATKRRVRRSQLRAMRQLPVPKQNAGAEPAVPAPASTEEKTAQA